MSRNFRLWRTSRNNSALFISPIAKRRAGLRFLRNQFPRAEVAALAYPPAIRLTGPTFRPLTFRAIASAIFGTSLPILYYEEAAKRAGRRAFDDEAKVVCLGILVEDDHASISDILLRLVAYGR